MGQLYLVTFLPFYPTTVTIHPVLLHSVFFTLPSCYTALFLVVPRRFGRLYPQRNIPSAASLWERQASLRFPTALYSGGIGFRSRSGTCCHRHDFCRYSSLVLGLWARWSGVELRSGAHATLIPNWVLFWGGRRKAGPRHPHTQLGTFFGGET
jgi:hypothetical protein